VLLTAGAQQGLALALAAVCRPGDTVLCEAATYYGIKSLAEHAGYRLVGLAMDGEGVLPEALETAAAGAAAVCLLPTVQNPTGRTMGEARRREIAEVARRRQLWIVEDDVYGRYQPGQTPIAAFAPDRTFFVTSMSKAVAPGVRAGALIPPAGGGHEAAILRAVHAVSVASGSLGWMIAAQWIESGVAEDIAQSVVGEAQMRLALAMDILGPAVERPASPASPHIWLPMPELEAERVAGRALRAGVQLTPPSACLAAPELESGLRLCLGAAPDRNSLERGLRAVAEALSPHPEAAGAQPMV
jgi:DNA-binding transcriptional MocR family regulator